MPNLGTLISDGTAAEHISMAKRDAADASNDMKAYSRVPVASEEWMVGVSNGVTYKVKFEGNFAKKHLFTYTKKEANQEAIAKKVSERVLGKKGDDAIKSPAEIRAEENNYYVLEKMRKNVNNRAKSGLVCKCGHPRKKHQQSNKDTTPVPCKDCPTTPPAQQCKAFQTQYEFDRLTKFPSGAGFDPLAGASTKKNGCIILSTLPRNELDKAIINGIKAANTAPANAHSPADRLIKIDFGAKRKGSVMYIDISGANEVTASYQGCWVVGHPSPTNTDKVVTWTIGHMESKAPYELF